MMIADYLGRVAIVGVFIAIVYAVARVVF